MGENASFNNSFFFLFPIPHSPFPIPHSPFPIPYSHLALTPLFTYTLPTPLKSPIDQLYDQRK
jgi:hypothetical protein